MSTPQGTLRDTDRATVHPIVNGGAVYVEVDFRQGAEATGVSRTIDISESVVEHYKPIALLRGKYEDSPFMRNFLRNIEEYNRELIDAHDE